jgi:ELWxxDGT repeat protein
VELWATNPTNESIWLVKDIHPTGSSTPFTMIEFAGALHFTADDGSNGRELWSVSAFNQTISFV